MGATTRFQGKSYNHDDFKITEKRKNLPEKVKKAIQGDAYVEPTVAEPTVINETN